MSKRLTPLRLSLSKPVHKPAIAEPGFDRLSLSGLLQTYSDRSLASTA